VPASSLELDEAFSRREVAAVFARLQPNVEIRQSAPGWTVRDARIVRFEAKMDTRAGL
jgi:hypothetical protein